MDLHIGQDYPALTIAAHYVGKTHHDIIESPVDQARWGACLNRVLDSGKWTMGVFDISFMGRKAQRLIRFIPGQAAAGGLFVVLEDTAIAQRRVG